MSAFAVGSDRDDGRSRPGTDPCARQQRSERLLATLAPFPRVVIVSHVNPDPDALASMLGLKALIEHCQPGKTVILTVDGMIARAENRAMVELLPIPLVPVDAVRIDAETAVVMVDSQPHTGRRASEARDAAGGASTTTRPAACSTGVLFRDIRPHLGATSTMVTGYLLEQARRRSRPGWRPPCSTGSSRRPPATLARPARSTTAPWSGSSPAPTRTCSPRSATPSCPQSHFATFQHALANAFLYRDVVVSWCGAVTQPDIIAELADFFVRFDQVNWALAVGLFENLLKLSVRVSPARRPLGRGPPRGRRRPRHRRRPRQARRRRDPADRHQPRGDRRDAPHRSASGSWPSSTSTSSKAAASSKPARSSRPRDRPSPSATGIALIRFRGRTTLSAVDLARGPTCRGVN